MGVRGFVGLAVGVMKWTSVGWDDEGGARLWASAGL